MDSWCKHIGRHNNFSVLPQVLFVTLGIFLTSFCLFHLLITVKVGNIGGREFAESLAPDVQKLLVSVHFEGIM